MTQPTWKRLLCTEEGWKDLDFYLAHQKEMYFYGLVSVAIMWLLVVAIGFLLMFTYMWGIGIALIGVLGFTQVKMFLHSRKDAIEIKEMLKEWNG